MMVDYRPGFGGQLGVKALRSPKILYLFSMLDGFQGDSELLQIGAALVIDHSEVVNLFDHLQLKIVSGSVPDKQLKKIIRAKIQLG